MRVPQPTSVLPTTADRSASPRTRSPDPKAMLETVRRASLVDDPLSAALARLRVRAMIAGVSELSGSWGLRCPTGPGGFYAVIEGAMYVLPHDGAPPTMLSAGDCAFITRGDEHVIRSDAHARLRPVLESFTPDDARKRRGVKMGPGNDRPTRFICGATVIDSLESLGLIGGVPDLIVSRRAHRAQPDVLWNAVELLLRVCADLTPGAQSVLDHLGAIVLIETLREHARQSAAGAALLDPRIGPVLGLMHGEPGRAWTLESLANEAGLSRSAFAVQFAELVGETPMAHLRISRMHRAAELLRTGDDDVGRIARRVGYASEGAFCTAFKKWAGKTPEEFRRSLNPPTSAATALFPSAPRDG